MMRVGIAVVIAGLLLPPVARADSRYSLRGAGESLSSMKAESRALGGAQTATDTPGLAGNPACAAFAEKGVFYGTYETEWIRVDEPKPSGGRKVLKEYSGVVPNLGVLYPLPGGVVFGTGLHVERRRGGTIEMAATDSMVAAIGGQEYQFIYEASGNALRIPAVAALRVGPVQAGVGADVVLVNSRERWQNDFPTGSGFEDSNDLTFSSLWAVGLRAGLRVPVGDRLSLGAWASLPGDLSGSRRFENDDPLDNSDDLEVDASGELPRVWSAGFEARPWPRVRVLGDWVREGWSEVTPSAPEVVHRDVDRFGFGVEVTPPERGGLRWPVRFGFRTEPLHALDSEGREIRETFLTAGSGLRFSGGRGLFDWFVEYGWRGEKDESEFREDVFRFGITLTGFEAWTRRPPPEEDW
ncbi:MAG: hypothetical protein QF819_02125 [Gemmatimonadota bacterium]|jgi:hypothetical protein|nr:hypothetical protein [Gemmatimonadota bacterium]MDP6530115.1 hypothetical protein [Gemmatimonadota bacterium]MDP6801957.1 hypothetical protein [Gemmatimonadota bacterium]MDP7031305.1 hypothetical protein [Gemmatimonadota bacterium]